MIKRLTYLLSSLVVSAILTSCSTDRLEAINFPETAKPGQTVSVAMVNAYLYLSNSKVVPNYLTSTRRDSIHLMIRVPDGYEVVSVKTAVVRDMPISSLIGSFNDLSSLAPFIAQYLAQSIVMNRNENLDSKFRGRTFEAHSTKDQSLSLPVSTDQGSWTGYSAPFGVSINPGDTLDTIISIDSILGMAALMGLDTAGFKDSIANINPLGIPLNIENIAFTAVPALIQITFKTKSTNGKDTLYFYSNTASTFPSQTDIDGGLSLTGIGSMLFAELDVSESSASIRNTGLKKESLSFSVIKNAGSCKIFYNLSNTQSKPSVSIYSSSGVLVRKLSLTPDGYGVWDYTDKSGINVSSGRYFATIHRKSGSDALPIDVIR